MSYQSVGQVALGRGGGGGGGGGGRGGGGGGGRGGGGGFRGGGGGFRGGGGGAFKGGGGGGGWKGGGGHHRRHGGGGGWWGGPGWWGGGWGWDWPWWYYPESEVFFVEGETPDEEQIKRAMAYIMSLPKWQRAAAYTKIFGTTPTPGVLGGIIHGGRGRSRSDAIALAGRGKMFAGDDGVGEFDTTSVVKIAAVAAGGYLLYKALKR